MYSSLMTQTGEDNRKGMIRIRPYGAGFGQFDSAYKVGEGILFKAKIPFYFIHFTGQANAIKDLGVAPPKYRAGPGFPFQSFFAALYPKGV